MIRRSRSGRERRTTTSRSRGLVLGKFLPYHAGHAHLIRSARAGVDALTVLVCSVAREPIPGGHRYQWVRASHPDCRVVHVSEEVPQAPEDDPAFWPIWIDLVRRYAGDVDVVFTSESLATSSRRDSARDMSASTGHDGRSPSRARRSAATR
jgi:HTH-type transcriptional repressor of NAD biosynthesis genes